MKKNLLIFIIGSFLIFENLQCQEEIIFKDREEKKDKRVKELRQGLINKYGERRFAFFTERADVLSDLTKTFKRSKDELSKKKFDFAWKIIIELNEFRNAYLKAIKKEAKDKQLSLSKEELTELVEDRYMLAFLSQQKKIIYDLFSKKDYIDIDEEMKKWTDIFFDEDVFVNVNYFFLNPLKRLMKKGKELKKEKRLTEDILIQILEFFAGLSNFLENEEERYAFKSKPQPFDELLEEYRQLKKDFYSLFDVKKGKEGNIYVTYNSKGYFTGIFGEKVITEEILNPFWREEITIESKKLEILNHLISGLEDTNAKNILLKGEGKLTLDRFFETVNLIKELYELALFIRKFYQPEDGEYAMSTYKKMIKAVENQRDILYGLFEVGQAVDDDNRFREGFIYVTYDRKLSLIEKLSGARRGVDEIRDPLYGMGIGFGLSKRKQYNGNVFKATFNLVFNELEKTKGLPSLFKDLISVAVKLKDLDSIKKLNKVKQSLYKKIISPFEEHDIKNKAELKKV